MEKTSASFTASESELLNEERGAREPANRIRELEKRIRLLESRIVDLETSNQSIARNAATATIFNTANCLKGCDVATVFVNGKATLNAAWFFRYIAADSAGNLYIGDQDNHVVRCIDLDGVASTIAGNGRTGFKDGRGAEAQFNVPIGVAVGPDDAVYVTDLGNHAIRRISNGTVCTVAGNGRTCFKDGIGPDAGFRAPFGCAVASDGTVYVADHSNHRIRRIAPDGTVTTIAGNGTAGFANGTGGDTQVNYPTGVAVDSHNNVYVADYCNHVIRRIAPSGTVTTMAGTGHAGFKDGPAQEAHFKYPTDVSVGRDGTIYVADLYNHAVRAIVASGMVTTIAGHGSPGCRDGSLREAEFHRPQGATVGPDGCLYIVDHVHIRKISGAACMRKK